MITTMPYHKVTNMSFVKRHKPTDIVRATQPAKGFLKLPKSVAWAADYDYWHKLSPEQKQWLKDFSNKYYQANFSKDKGLPDWSPKEKRKSYSNKNSANRDIYPKAVDLDE